MGAYLSAAEAIVEAFDCAVIIVHHCGTDSSRPRGHTSLTGAVDAQLAVKRDGAGNVAVVVEWMKDGKDGSEITSRLETVEVGTNSDGAPITSCAVVPAADMPAGKKAAAVTGKTRIALDALYELIASDGEIVASNHIPEQRTSVDVRLWRQYFYNRTVGEDIEDKKRNTKEKAFKRAVDRLQELKMIGIWNDRVWPAGQERT
jgi:hypothetical protein